MDNTLLTKIATLKEELKTYKVRQQTQNDSYQYYVYRTGNFFLGSSYRQYRIEFIPNGKKEGTICIFQDFDMTFSNATGQADVNNPLVYIFTVPVISKTFPELQRQIYVTCLSNRTGVLLATQL